LPLTPHPSRAREEIFRCQDVSGRAREHVDAAISAELLADRALAERIVPRILFAGA